MFSYRQTINTFMEGRYWWPMQFFFVTIFEKESRVFCNILYRCLKRIKVLFKTPASPFSPGCLFIRERVFSSEICDNVRSVFWNSFTRKCFPKTKQATSVSEFSTINRWIIPFWLVKISFPCGSSTGLWKQRFKSSGNRDWVLQTGAIRMMRGTDSCFIFRSTNKILLKGGDAYGRPMFQICIIASVPS